MREEEEGRRGGGEEGRRGGGEEGRRGGGEEGGGRREEGGGEVGRWGGGEVGLSISHSVISSIMTTSCVSKDTCCISSNPSV